MKRLLLGTALAFRKSRTLRSGFAKWTSPACRANASPDIDHGEADGGEHQGRQGVANRPSDGEGGARQL